MGKKQGRWVPSPAQWQPEPGGWQQSRPKSRRRIHGEDDRQQAPEHPDVRLLLGVRQAVVALGEEVHGGGVDSKIHEPLVLQEIAQHWCDKGTCHRAVGTYWGSRARQGSGVQGNARSCVQRELGVHGAGGGITESIHSGDGAGVQAEVDVPGHREGLVIRHAVHPPARQTWARDGRQRAALSLASHGAESPWRGVTSPTWGSSSPAPARNPAESRSIPG